MPDQYLYTYKRSTFDNPSEVIFINQKEIAELDRFFGSHLVEVTKLFADYGLKFIYLPALLTPEYVDNLLNYQMPGLSVSERAVASSKVTPQNIYQEFNNEEYFENPILYYFTIERYRDKDSLLPRRRRVPKLKESIPKYTGLVWARDSNLAPSLTECAEAEEYSGGHGAYYFFELDGGNESSITDQIDRFLKYRSPEQYDAKHPPEIEFSSNVSFVSEDEGAMTMHNADAPQPSDDEPNELILYSMTRPPENVPGEKDGDQKPEQVQELSKFERALQAIRDSDHGIILSRISKNSSIGLPLGVDDKFTQEAYQLSQEIIERVEKLRKIGINELIIRSLVAEAPKPSRLLVTKDYRLFLPDYNNKEIVMGPLPKAVFLLFLRHPEGIMFKRISEWKNELLGLYCRCAGRVVDEEVRQSVDKLTDPLSNSLNEKCSRIREAFLREMDDSIARNYYITGDRATPKRIQLDRELVEWGV